MSKKQMLEEAMARICYVRELQQAYLACTTALQRRNREYKVGDNKVYYDLMQWELAEWRGLLMWALVADQDTQDRIKAAAHERFLSDRMEVASWFHDGVHPGRYLSADEEEFRRMAKEAFKPKEEA